MVRGRTFSSCGGQRGAHDDLADERPDACAALRHFKIQLTLRAASPYDAFYVVRQARLAFLHGEPITLGVVASVGGVAPQDSRAGWWAEFA